MRDLSYQLLYTIFSLVRVSLSQQVVCFAFVLLRLRPETPPRLPRRAVCVVYKDFLSDGDRSQCPHKQSACSVIHVLIAGRAAFAIMLEKFGIYLFRKICLITESSWPCSFRYPLVLHEFWVSIHHAEFPLSFFSHDLKGGTVRVSSFCATIIVFCDIDRFMTTAVYPSIWNT